MFAVLCVLSIVWMLLCPRPLYAQDYDINSSEWNGLRELVTLAQEVDVELRPVRTLDWSQIGRGQGLLMLYPLTDLDLRDLEGLLEDGGRFALFDDFGNAGRVLDWFQVTRRTDAHGEPRSPQLPGMLVAWRRIEHPLTEGVDSLVTNEPTVLSHRRLSPVFAFSDEPGQGVVLAGQVERGRLVIGGDPSVLINTMLRFPGNRQFARNLLLYLAGRRGGQVYLVHSRFRVQGIYRTRGRARTPAREVVQTIDQTLARIVALGQSSAVLPVFALMVFALTALGVGLKIWGQKPNDRFGPTGPAGAAAATAQKVSIFSVASANFLYPTLVAKRYFERGLLRAAGLKPPTDVGAVLQKAQGRLSADQQAELRALLIELDRLATPVEDGGPARVSARRFLSLWRRIGAILTALGDRV